MAHSLIINAGYEDSDHYIAEEIFRMVLIAAGTYIFYQDMLFLYLHRKKKITDCVQVIIKVVWGISLL